MKFRPISSSLFVSRQLLPEDVAKAAHTGFRLIICNRPDGEETSQPLAATIAAEAARHGLAFVDLPISGKPSDSDVARMEAALTDAGGPALAYCRSGNRSARIGALALSARIAPEKLVGSAARAGFEIGELTSRLALRYMGVQKASIKHFDVVVIGGGASGIAAAASLLRRRRGLRLAIVEPAEYHYYQPGWTMVGAGIFSRASTTRPMVDVIPRGATWIRAAATAFDPTADQVELEDGRVVAYDALIVATGLTLDWDAVPGLSEALGRNGVTSNYRVDLAPYTAKLVAGLTNGRAIFTQPPMPIKCAGAPQKAMYLSCDSWRRAGTLDRTQVSFHTATPGLFGVAAYVPALMQYIERYGIDLNLGSRLVAVDGGAKTATFERLAPDGSSVQTIEAFDMLHACPPQIAPAVVVQSALAGAGGFVDVDPGSLRHSTFTNVFALGDVAATSNAKTAAAARKQAPVVAENVLATLDHKPLAAVYDGYGSCPLTVERGRIVLAEFGYGGTLMPSFPNWLLDGTRPTRLAWFLKASLLPKLYWHGMLKGREWLASPKTVRR